MIARQGDLLIKRITDLPKGLKIRKSLVILRGESTGHKHQLTKGSVLDGKNGLIYLLLSKSAQITHDEHKPINLKAGKYIVIRQREYVMADMTRLVAD